jgi:hypothetical protein
MSVYHTQVQTANHPISLNPYFSLILQQLFNLDIKGTVSRYFFAYSFFMTQFPPSPRVSHWDRFEFFRKLAEIFASQSAPPVSMTPATNFATSFAGVVDTSGK